MTRSTGWVARTAGGLLSVMVTACGGPALTPLQSQYQSEAERASRYHARGELPRALAAYQDAREARRVAERVLDAKLKAAGFDA